MSPNPSATTLDYPLVPAPPPVLEVVNLKKIYRTGSSELVLFQNLSFTVAAGELLAIVGESGAGKSTLLHLLGALDAPTSGSVTFAGENINAMSEAGAAEFRNRHIGYVWQFHYLLPEFSALENVAMPLLARGASPPDAYARAAQLLARVALAARSTHRPGELSGGEQQRVAFARALVTSPRILLADEPTGDLDNRTAETVFDLLRGLHQESSASPERLTSLVVTHNLSFARRCDRILRLRNGSIEPVSPEMLA